MLTQIWVNICSCNVLLPYDTNPLPAPIFLFVSMVLGHSSANTFTATAQAYCIRILKVTLSKLMLHFSGTNELIQFRLQSLYCQVPHQRGNPISHIQPKSYIKLIYTIALLSFVVVISLTSDIHVIHLPISFMIASSKEILKGIGELDRCQTTTTHNKTV